LIPTLADEAASVFGLRGPYPGCIGYIGSVRCWWLPTDNPKEGWKLAEFPRGIALYAPAWMVRIDTDSTEEAWIVYTRGDIKTHEQAFRRLIDGEEFRAWPTIATAWKRDMERRADLLVQTRAPYPAGQSGTTRPHLSPRDEAPEAGMLRGSSILTPSSTALKFGQSTYARRSGRTRTTRKRS